jgi:hypothetical protein
MMNHPDCLEGVRARILEKDNRPRWRPERIEKVEPFSLAQEEKEVPKKDVYIPRKVW